MNNNKELESIETCDSLSYSDCLDSDSNSKTVMYSCHGIDESILSDSIKSFSKSLCTNSDEFL